MEKNEHLYERALFHQKVAITILDDHLDKLSHDNGVFIDLCQSYLIR